MATTDDRNTPTTTPPLDAQEAMQRLNAAINAMPPELRPAHIDSEMRRARPAQRAAWQRLGDTLTLLTTQRAIAARTSLDPRLDAVHIADMLATLVSISQDDLPDGDAREALADAIRAGEVDNLYRPMGADYYNIAWAHRPAWEDPRQRLSDWLLRRQQGGQG